MAVFDERIGDTEAYEKSLVEAGARRGKAPGQQSGGNGASTSGGFSNLVDATTETKDPARVGIDPDGNMFYPFVLGVDYIGDPCAYLPEATEVYDFGN